MTLELFLPLSLLIPHPQCIRRPLASPHSAVCMESTHVSPPPAPLPSPGLHHVLRDNCSSLLFHPSVPVVGFRHSFFITAVGRLFQQLKPRRCYSSLHPTSSNGSLNKTKPHPPYLSDLISCQPLPRSLFPRHNSFLLSASTGSLPLPQSLCTHYFFYLQCPSS